MQVSSLSRTDATKVAAAHGWINTATVKTRLGNFEFTGGYPTDDTARRLTDQLTYNRAVEVYLAQIPVVSSYHVWKGIADAGAGVPNQLLIWESSMDAGTLVLTGNPETVSALCALDLERDGPAVVEAPAGISGGVTDLWQHTVVDIGARGEDTSRVERFLLLPPDYDAVAPQGYHVSRSPTYRAVLGLRGSLVDGRPDHAVALLKRTKVYPLAKSGSPPPMSFVNASGTSIDLVFPDTEQFFEDLSHILEQEPVVRLSSEERFQLAAIGIEKGRRFAPGPDRKPVLDDAARFGAAIARANSFASADPARLVYPDRRWEWACVGGRASWDAQGYVNTDRRAAFAYIGFGMSPAMVNQVVGHGCPYLWTSRDSSGAYLDGGQRYHLLLPPNIPVRQSWSVVVYDAVSRSMLQNGEKSPTISSQTRPDVNSDGSVDIYFGPVAPPGHETNWIRTMAGRGWFPLLRFHAPLEPFFDKSWKPDDVVEVKYAVPDTARTRF